MTGHTRKTTGKHSLPLLPRAALQPELMEGCQRSLRCEQALHLNRDLNLKINTGGGRNLFPKGFGTLPSFVNTITAALCSTRHICMNKWSIFSLKRDCLLNVIRGSNFTDEDYSPWLEVVIVFYLWAHLASLLYTEYLKKITGLQFHGTPCREVNYSCTLQFFTRFLLENCSRI